MSFEAALKRELWRLREGGKVWGRTFAMKSVWVGEKWSGFDGIRSVMAEIDDGLAFAMKSEGIEVKMVGKLVKGWTKVTFAMKSSEIREGTKI